MISPEALPATSALELIRTSHDLAVGAKAAKPLPERIVVYVRKNRKETFKKANFSICLFDFFALKGHSGFVECFIQDSRVYLQLPKRRGEDVRKTHKQSMVYLIEHPVFCAIHRLTEETRSSLPEETANRGVDVGVSVLLETSDGKILVIRRAYHSRTFPGIWVPPGGHIEENETFEEAGLREVCEETGLFISPSMTNQCHLLGLWESTYPAALYEGDPRRHHLVLYYHFLLPYEEKEAQMQIKLDPEEVDASMWLSEDLITLVTEGMILRCHLEKIVVPITIVNRDGTYSSGFLDPKVLRKKMPAPERIVERLSTGTRYALRLWLLKKKGRKNSNIALS